MVKVKDTTTPAAVAREGKEGNYSKRAVTCSECGSDTYRKGGVCKACASPKTCVCGGPLMTRFNRQCEACREWGSRLSASLNASRRKERKLTKLQSDEWLSWANTKNAILHNRSRLCLNRNAVLRTPPGNWSEWADNARKTKLRKNESAWQKKCRNWQRGLTTRSRAERN